MFEPPGFPGDHKMGVFEDLEVLHHAEPAHIELLFQFSQGLPVFPAQAVQQRTAGRGIEGFEDRFHG